MGLTYYLRKKKYFGVSCRSQAHKISSMCYRTKRVQLVSMSHDKCSQAFPVFRRSSASMYYTEHKPKNKNGGGLGTRLTSTVTRGTRFYVGPVTHSHNFKVEGQYVTRKEEEETKRIRDVVEHLKEKRTNLTAE